MVLKRSRSIEERACCQSNICRPGTPLDSCGGANPSRDELSRSMAIVGFTLSETNVDGRSTRLLAEVE